MQIKIPNAVARVFENFSDWGDVAVYRHGQNELRRIDVLMIVFGIFIVVYHYSVGGWLYALQALAFYVFGIMATLWIIR